MTIVMSPEVNSKSPHEISSRTHGQIPLLVPPFSKGEFSRKNSLSLERRLCRNPKNRARVILSPSEGSAFLSCSCRIGVGVPKLQTKKQILRRSTPQNDMATQPQKREGEIFKYA